MKQKRRNGLDSGDDAETGPEERKRLQESIRQWNLNRLSLFEITEPDEHSIFHGVIRFYFQDHVSGNCATKCICISSTSTTEEVIETLLEKFQLDEASHPFPYCLYEVFGNEEGRQLHLSEKPLVVQLNWAKDNTDGRFVLRNGSSLTLQNGCLETMEKVGLIENFKRTLSRKEKTKKKQKKKELSKSHTLEKDEYEDSFLLAVVNDINSSTIHFKLSPAYVFYLVGRFITSQSEQRNKIHQQTEQNICRVFDKIVRLIQDVIQKQRNIAVALAFWMANTSELLNFIRQDQDLSPITLQAQNTLAHLVQQAFRYLSNRLRVDLENDLPGFFTDVEETAQAKEIEGVLNALIKTMNLLRRCRVNPALSIQLFSQQLHFMGAWLLNRLTGAGPGSTLCSHYWGKTLRQRLRHVEAWAERQGLELAVDCHLSRVIQATMVLTMSPYSTRDAQTIQSTCYKLNSLQLWALMSKYHYAPNQPHFPPGLMEHVVALAKATTDVLRGEGGDIRLEEELDLHLPFLLPEDGYSCDSMRGIPQGFQEFLEPICRKGLCKLIPHTDCVGTWTIFFGTSECPTERSASWKLEPVKIILKKPLHAGMGVSIVAAKGAGQEKLGIFIKSIVHGGAANVDGRLNPCDQLLSVDGQSLVGVSQERAAEIMMQTRSVVTLEVVKSAAVYYGLDEMFTQPCQTTSKDHDNSEQVTQTSSVSDVCDSTEPSLSDPSRPSKTWRNQHTVNRPNKKQNQKLIKKKLEYCSNPNLASNQEMAVDSGVPERMTVSFSTYNLIEYGEPRSTSSDVGTLETYHRQYQTLPASKPQSNNAPSSDQSQHKATFSRNQQKMNFMKQARSQDNLWSVDQGRLLLDRPKYLKIQHDLSKWKSLGTIRPMNPNYSSSPMGHWDGLWRVPTAAQSVPLSQPKRVDVPYSPEANTLSFSTFCQPVSPAPVVATQPVSSTHSQNENQNKSSLEVLKPLIQPKPSQRLQQQKVLEKTIVILQPTQNTSQNNPKNRSPSQHLSANPDQNGHKRVDKTSTLPTGDPWNWDAQKKLENQQMTGQLQQEVQLLQAKVQRTLEESDRLRRLSLELQFQKRLEEFQMDENEEDERTEWMWFKTGSDKESNNRNTGLLCKNESPAVQQSEDGVTQESTGCDNNVTPEKFSSGEMDHKSFKTLRSPENLSFKERQQLFSLAKFTSSKAKVS
ncbi:afadin [Myxocyprinus asiaticus]|uniref:afadin n=1 Tax=Myxocyprinus asiaticus TaxID=70543 RepID=UPI0022223628|nr:afadin [Myxocyprinus asiaticus]